LFYNQSDYHRLKGETSYQKNLPFVFAIPVIDVAHSLCACHTYEGQSNENLKYVLSRNLLNTKGTQ